MQSLGPFAAMLAEGKQGGQCVIYALHDIHSESAIDPICPGDDRVGVGMVYAHLK
jgi:hypothetical protein